MIKINLLGDALTQGGAKKGASKVVAEPVQVYTGEGGSRSSLPIAGVVVGLVHHAARDAQEEQEYSQRTKLRMAASRSETDSVNRQIAIVRRSADSLAAIAGNQQARQRQYD